MMDTVPEKKIVSVNFIHAVFSILVFFEFETDILSWNVRVTTMGCIIFKKSADLRWWFGDGELGLARHGPVQSNPAWNFISEFRMTSHTEVPSLGEKPCLELEQICYVFWWKPFLMNLKNCRLTSVSQFGACPSSNVAQLTAHWHPCHS